MNYGYYRNLVEKKFGKDTAIHYREFAEYVQEIAGHLPEKEFNELYANLEHDFVQYIPLPSEVSVDDLYFGELDHLYDSWLRTLN